MPEIRIEESKKSVNPYRHRQFDPEGSGYDYYTAHEAGFAADDSGHWPSRDPRTGQLLKGRRHETWDLLEKGERDAGYEIYQGPDGRYYSRPVEGDDISNNYLLGRQVAHEYHSDATQMVLDLTNQQELERQQAEYRKQQGFQEGDAETYRGGLPGGHKLEEDFARDMVEDMRKRRGKDDKTLYEQEGEAQTEEYFNQQQAEKVQAETAAELGGAQAPNFDPVMAGAGAFGAMTSLSLNAGKALMPSLGRAVASLVVSAAGDIVPGVGMDVLEVKAPALALPFGIAVSLLQGATVENAIERGIVKAAQKAGQKISKEAVTEMVQVAKLQLANERGEVVGWHGSPHYWDKPDLSRIGSGEGNQSFGWGLYFSDLKDIAKHYATNITDKEYIKLKNTIKSKYNLDDSWSGSYVRDSLALAASNQFTVDEIADSFRKRIEAPREGVTEHDIEQIKRGLDGVEDLKSGKLKRIGGGFTYKAILHPGRTDEVWLDWDKPIDQAKYKKILDSAYNEYGSGHPVVDALMRMNPAIRDIKGEGIYYTLAAQLGKGGRDVIGMKEASLFLSRAGIDGIRYPAGSLSNIKPKYFLKGEVLPEEHSVIARWALDKSMPDSVFRKYKNQEIQSLEQQSQKDYINIIKKLKSAKRSDFEAEKMPNNYVVFDENAISPLTRETMDGVIEELNTEIAKTPLKSAANLIKSQRGSVEIGGEPPAKPKAKKSGIPAPPDMQKSADEFLADTNPDITVETAGNIRLWGGTDLEPKFMSDIETPEDINRIIAGTQETFAGQTEAARRGTRTWEDTAEAARQYNIEDLLGRRLGQALNAEQIDNARTMLVSSSETLKAMAAKVRLGQATDLEKMDFMRAFNTHYAIQMQLAGAAAEAGRALNIFRKVAQSDTLRVGQIQDFLSAAGAANISPEKLAQGLSELDSPAQVAKFVKQARRATTWDMLMEAWINGLLSGPVTHAVNSTSNALVALYAIPERAAAWGFSKLLGDGAIQGGEVAAQTFGLIEGFKDGLKAAGRALRTGQSTDVSGKIEQPYRAITAENVARLPVINKLAPNALAQGGVAAWAVDALGEAVRIPGRFLTAEDDFFKAAGYRMELRARAYRQAASENLTGDAAARRIQEIVENPQEMAPEIHLAAIDAARYQTFTRELGEAGRAFQAAVNKSKIGKVILPFVRTPANIMKYAVERSGPLGLVLKSVRDDIAAGGARRDLALARMSLGGMIMAASAYYAASGRITGGGPADSKMKSYLYNQGWQPYSIKIGDTYYSYGRLEPLGMMMGLAADFVEISGELSRVEADKLAVHIAAAFSRNVMSKTFLRGLSEVVEALDDPERYGEHYVQRLAGTVVPSAAAQLERELSPEMSDVRSIMDSIKSRIPGFSDQVPVRRNLWGEPIVLSGGLGPDMISPVYTSKKRESPADAELYRLARETGRAPVSMPRREFTVQGVGISFDGLAPEAYGEFLQAMNAVKLPVYGKPLKETLDRMVTRDPGYKRLDDERKITMIQGVVRLARDLAVQQMYNENKYRLREIVDAEMIDRQRAANF